MVVQPASSYFLLSNPQPCHNAPMWLAESWTSPLPPGMDLQLDFSSSKPIMTIQPHFPWSNPSGQAESSQHRAPSWSQSLIQDQAYSMRGPKQVGRKHICSYLRKEICFVFCCDGCKQGSMLSQLPRTWCHSRLWTVGAASRQIELVQRKGQS